jgi:protein SCO1/2
MISLALLFIFNFAHADERPLPFFAAKDLTPYWDLENARAEPATIDSLKAVNQDNRVVTENNFSGHLSLVNFFFAECGATCPLMMHTLQSLQPKIGDVKTFSFSVDPKHDGPAELKSYANHHHFDLRNWELLTGSQKEIYRLGRDVFKADGSVSAKSPAFIHTTNIYLVDRKRRVRGVYDSVKADAMNLLVKDIARLMREP